MWLLRAALRNPISIVVIVIGVALCSVLALTRMPIDIFPNLNLPVIYVAQPYGGMSPAQMEGYLVYYYEYHFLYITGIESVESKSIQNVGLLKLTFHPNRLRAYHMTPEEVVKAVSAGNIIMPAGNIRAGDLQPMVPINSVVSNIQELSDLPIRVGSGPAVFLHDIA